MAVHFGLDFITPCSPMTMLFWFCISVQPTVARNPNQKVHILVWVCIFNTHGHILSPSLLFGATVHLQMKSPCPDGVYHHGVDGLWEERFLFMTTEYLQNCRWTNKYLKERLTSAVSEVLLPWGFFSQYIVSAIWTVNFDYQAPWLWKYYVSSQCSLNLWPSKAL